VTTHPGWTPDGHDGDPGGGAPTTPDGRPVPRGVGTALPPTAPDPDRRRTRLVVIAAAVLVTAAAVAGVLTHRTPLPDPGPDSPTDAAEAFVTAGLRHDWRASWELLCRSEQHERGPFDRYVSVQETASLVIGRPDDAGTTVRVGTAHPYTYVDLEAHLVELQLTRAGQTHEMHLVVVREEEGFRACGQR
jgi:hypothetical protein